MRKIFAAGLIVLLGLSGCKKHGGLGTGSWTIEPGHGVYHPLNASGEPLQIMAKLTPSNNDAEYFVLDASESRKASIQFPVTNIDSLGMHIPYRGPGETRLRWDKAPDYLLIFNNSLNTITISYSFTTPTD